MSEWKGFDPHPVILSRAKDPSGFAHAAGSFAGLRMTDGGVPDVPHAVIAFLVLFTAQDLRGGWTFP